MEHGCDIKMFSFSSTNHAHTNLKKFSSSKLDKFTFLFIFTTKRREWVCSSNCGATEKTKNGKQYSPRDIETANRLSIESAK